jgi:Cu/Ag efflux pump CusA
MVLGLALLFYQWRTALVAVVAILSSVVAAVLVVYLRGSTFNTLIFAGLAVGLAVVVDEAVISAENVARRVRELGQGPGDRALLTGVVDATVDLRRGLGFATLVILLPLLPVFFLTGLGSAFGRPLALSYGLALVVSMLVALTITPALGVLVFSGAPAGRRESPLMGWLGSRYQRLLHRALQTPAPAFLTLAVLAVVGLLAVPRLQSSPLPTFKETDFLVDLDGPPGTSLAEMERVTARVSQELRSIPGVRRVGGHVGRAIQSDRVVNPDSSQLWVSLEPGAKYDEAVAAVKKVVKGYPGLDSDVMTYPQERFKEAGTGADEPVVVRLYGSDLDVLRPKAEEVAQALHGIKGLTNLHAELPRLEPTVQVDVNLDAAKAAGIKPGDVRRAATTLLSGLLVGNTFEEQKVFQVVVWGTPETRQNLDTVRDLLIETPSGGHVRLGDVAKVDVKPAANVIERDAAMRFVDITAGVHGRGRNAVLADVRARLAQVKFPLEYHYELVGNYAERQAAQHRVLLAGLAAALGIFLLLQAAFGSWRLAALLFLTLPLALVGGVLAVIVDGGTMELGSLVGFLAIFGIAVRNGVILIRRYQLLERHEDVPFGRDLVVRGARERLSPILVTAAATAVFFLPFALLGDLPGHEIVNPMAGVILGGLVTSTVLNLLLVPGLYLSFGYGQGQIEELDLRDLWEEVQLEDGRSGHQAVPGGAMVGREVGSVAAPERPQ